MEFAIRRFALARCKNKTLALVAATTQWHLIAGRGAVHSIKSALEWQGAIDCVRSLHEKLDIPVNNAGIAQRSGLLDASLGEWEAVLRVNLTGPSSASRPPFHSWGAVARSSMSPPLPEQ